MAGWDAAPPSASRPLSQLLVQGHALRPQAVPEQSPGPLQPSPSPRQSSMVEGGSWGPGWGAGMGMAGMSERPPREAGIRFTRTASPVRHMSPQPRQARKGTFAAVRQTSPLRNAPTPVGALAAGRAAAPGTHTGHWSSGGAAGAVGARGTHAGLSSSGGVAITCRQHPPSLNLQPMQRPLQLLALTSSHQLLPTASSPVISASSHQLLPTASSPIIPTSSHQLLPTVSSSPAPTWCTTSHQLLPTASSPIIPTSSHQLLPTASSSPAPTTSHQLLPTASNSPVTTSSDHQLLPTASSPPLPTTTTNHQLLPTASSPPLPTTSHQLLPTDSNSPVTTSSDHQLLPTDSSPPVPTSSSMTCATPSSSSSSYASCSEMHSPEALAPQPLPPAAASQDVALRGVTLGYLEQLLLQGAVDVDWSIQDVVDRYVRPATAARRCCLFDLVPAPSTGTPRFFISHTWSRRLRELLQMLRAHFELLWGAEAAAEDGTNAGGALTAQQWSSQVLVWLDIVAINQHPYEDKGCLLLDDVASLAKVVASTEQTLLCLDPECVVLSRIWCLFEVWRTFEAKGVAGLRVLMPAVDACRLRELFNTFDVTAARATQPADRDRILADIAASVGAVDLNLRLKAALVDSAAHEAAHSRSAGAELAAVLSKAALLAEAGGKLREARPLYQRAHGLLVQQLGDEHPASLAAQHALGACMSSLNSNKGERLLSEALDGQTRVLGAEHEATLSTRLDLGDAIRGPMMMDLLGRDGEAEAHYRAVVGARSRLLGAGHRDTLTALSKLASLLNNGGGRDAEVEAMLGGVVEAAGLGSGSGSGLGPSAANTEHPAALRIAGLLAACVESQGRPGDAERLLRRALEGWQRVVGSEHLSTAEAVYYLAEFLARQGKTNPDVERGDAQLGEAKSLYLKAAAVFGRARGGGYALTRDALRAARCCYRPTQADCPNGPML